MLLWKKARCRHLSNNVRQQAMRLMANYFDHLLSLDTPTYTVAQIAERFEPSTVLWAFHTIQPSSFFIFSVDRFFDVPGPIFAKLPDDVVCPEIVYLVP